MNITFFTKYFGVAILFSMLFLGAPTLFAATGTIDAVSYKSFLCSDDACTTGSVIAWKTTNGTAVSVTDSALTGNLWGENVGWINLNPTNGGVTNDGNGVLGGYAWGENMGWINFAPTHGGVSISTTTGEFSGWAWSENYGWIKFACPGSDTCVKTDWTTTVTPTPTPVSVGVPLVDSCLNIEGIQLGVPPGYIYSGGLCTPVVPTPTTTACSDGTDNDADGLTDMNDPGCTSFADNSEQNTLEQITCQILGNCPQTPEPPVTQEVPQTNTQQPNISQPTTLPGEQYPTQEPPINTEISNIVQSFNTLVTTIEHSFFAGISDSFSLIPSWMTNKGEPVFPAAEKISPSFFHEQALFLLGLISFIGLIAGTVSLPYAFWYPVSALFTSRRAIHGVVCANRTADSLDNIALSLVDDKENIIARTFTDHKGRFSFPFEKGTFKVSLPHTHTFAPFQNTDPRLRGYEGEFFTTTEKTQIKLLISANETALETPISRENMYRYSWRFPYGLLFYVGFIFSLAVCATAPTVLNTLVVGIYLFIIRLR